MTSNLLTASLIPGLLLLFLVSHPIPTQSTDDICYQTESFDSIFMLSGDTFFKTPSGKIWRMSATRFRKSKIIGHPWKTTERMLEFESEIFQRFG